MCDLQTTNPKSYWSIINRSVDSKKVHILNDNTVDTCYDHFNNLNQEQEADFSETLVEQIAQYNTELNMKISELEIKQAIKGLKNNKTCADDVICNAFIKATEYGLCRFMLDCLTLFSILVMSKKSGPRVSLLKFSEKRKRGES